MDVQLSQRSCKMQFKNNNPHSKSIKKVYYLSSISTVFPAADLPPTPQVNVSYCFQKCIKAVTSLAKAIHHLMDDNQTRFCSSMKSFLFHLYWKQRHSAGTECREINAHTHLHCSPLIFVF